MTLLTIVQVMAVVCAGLLAGIFLGDRAGFAYARPALSPSSFVQITRAVNVPINNQLMTWSAAAPPANLRELWAPWERVHTIRTIVAVGAFVLEAVALGLLTRG